MKIIQIVAVEHGRLYALTEDGELFCGVEKPADRPVPRIEWFEVETPLSMPAFA